MDAKLIGEEEKYSERKFWKKVNKYAKKIGRDALEKILQLYYAAQNPETPKWAKNVIYGALVYLVSPIDAIPDVVPAAGLTDDLGLIALAIANVAIYITTDIKKQAKEKVKEWFD